MMKERLMALDALRGLAVAGMILATSPGSWSDAYAPLQHAHWNGATATDMVFPTFLFAVGMAIGLSFPRSLTRSDRGRIWARLLRRMAALIALGLFLQLLPSFDVAHLRIPGILQRIALCYGLGVACAVATARERVGGHGNLNPAAIATVALALLAGYWLIMALVPLGGFGAGRYDPEGNLAAVVDRALFTVPHLWPYGTDAAGKVVYDPEGLLSTLPATVNVLIGMLAGQAWKSTPDRRTLVLIAIGGAVLVGAGLLIDPIFPINKRIWTSSFALLSSGVSALMLALLAALSRLSAARVLFRPLLVLGSNAIAAFVLSQLLGVFSGLPLLRGGAETPQAWGYALAQGITPDPKFASLLCALAILALIIAVLWPLHRRAIHFRL
jgi:predicted acyltransferase